MLNIRHAVRVILSASQRTDSASFSITLSKRSAIEKRRGPSEIRGSKRARISDAI